jgi:anthranilate/para-aminobenzoate synthase component II
MNEYMELVIRQKLAEFDKEVSVKFDWDADIYKVAEELYGLLIALGYHPESVCEILNTEMCEDED